MAKWYHVRENLPFVSWHSRVVRVKNNKGVEFKAYMNNAAEWFDAESNTKIPNVTHWADLEEDSDETD